MTDEELERLTDEELERLTDKVAVRLGEGWLTDAEYAEAKAARQALRDEINRLEALTAEEMLSADNNNNT